MKEKRIISRKQFLTGSATVIIGALLGKLSNSVSAEERTQNTNNIAAASAEEKEWEKLPLDILRGAYLVSDPDSELFGGTLENPTGLLTQYFHVYPGLKVKLSCKAGNAEMNGWIGYNRQLNPVSDLFNCVVNNIDNEKTVIITIPQDVFFLRGSGSEEGSLCAWVKSIAAYTLTCGISRPDLSSYTEITGLSFHHHPRGEHGFFDENTNAYPALGDVFFAPIGTDIVLTFNNASISPYIYSGENYISTNRKNLFSRCYSFGYSWYHCKTTEICNWLGAFYESVNGCAKTLTTAELQTADPHLYIRFPSTALRTGEAALIRAKGITSNYKRLFTVVHVTDTHGDMDSTHAAFDYADQIKADFIALTGDYVPYWPQHGYNMLHSIIRHAKTPTVLTVGNHDVYSYSDQLVYESSIAPIRDVLQAAEDYPYYYRDFSFEDETVRAISLYPFFEGSNTRYKGYYTHKQLLWLCDVMATAPDGAHIFLLRHFSHYKPIIPDDEQSMFYDYTDSNTEVGYDHWLDMGADPITGIVDAYNKKEKIYAQYTGYLKDRSEIISVQYDFSRRPNSEFVAYFTGHEHIDAVGYARNTQTKQVVLCSLCTTGVKGTEEYHAYTSIDSPRDYGTDSQIALNVFSFDFEKKKIYVARVGNQLFHDREKKWIEMSYV